VRSVPSSGGAASDSYDCAEPARVRNLSTESAAFWAIPRRGLRARSPPEVGNGATQCPLRAADIGTKHSIRAGNPPNDGRFRNLRAVSAHFRRRVDRQLRLRRHGQRPQLVDCNRRILRAVDG
jgi:hypothetical protein